MFQWFLRFTEFTEIQLHLEKSSLDIADLDCLVTNVKMHDQFQNKSTGKNALIF